MKYPSDSVERFDSQFAESEEERNARLAYGRKRRVLFDQLAELTKRWTTYEDIPRSQQLECTNIGKSIYALGKEALMREAYYHATERNRAASVIAAYWHGIGDWQW